MRDAGELKIVYRNLSWIVDVPNTDPATKKQQPRVQKRVLSGLNGTMRPVRHQGQQTAAVARRGSKSLL